MVIDVDLAIDMAEENMDVSDLWLVAQTYMYLVFVLLVEHSH